jgi:secondary thiamine-phosphate synthase enzyme
MAAHVRSMLSGTGLSVPVGGGRLLLGTWQGIYLWEHRTAPHRRQVVVTVLGS